MKTAIYYFTGTGNSLAAAKWLSAELGDAELFSIAKIMKLALGNDKRFSPSCQRIVIISPVYAGGLPNIVEGFVRRLKLDGKEVYSIVTHGGAPGKVLLQLAKLLKEYGSSLKGGFMLHMPGNAITLYSAAPKSEQDKRFRIAKLRLKEIADKIANGEDYPVEQNWSLLGTILSGPIRKGFRSYAKNMDKAFFATDRCNSCGICVKICPVENIKLVDGKPVWNHNCEQCMACIQWCPKLAIEHGRMTKGRKRYTHPQIKVEELVLR